MKKRILTWVRRRLLMFWKDEIKHLASRRKHLLEMRNSDEQLSIDYFMARLDENFIFLNAFGIYELVNWD